VQFCHIKPERITILPYALEQKWFENPTPCTECDTLFAETDPDKPMLIFYAELKHGLIDFLGQGVDRILETFQRIRELQKVVILETDDPAYKQLFQKRGAIVVENPSDEHLAHLFHRAGLYVQTARYEPRVLPLMAAMASRLPIISFPVGLAEDVIETGKNGFLVQNLIQLIAKVDFLRNNPEKAKEYGQNSYTIAKNKFSLAKCLEQYQKFFSNLIN
jgi:glycosyltransferase involved in cell wall biosynthesis